MKRLDAVLFAALLALPGSALAEAGHGGEPAAHEAPPAAHGGGPRSCEEILGGHAPSHESASVAEVIFHHVSDVTEIEFENPLPSEHPSALKIDFKAMLCRATGWNGVVNVGGLNVDLTPTKHLVWMWVAGLLLVIVFWWSAPKKGVLVPRGLAMGLEMVVVFIRDEIARKNIGAKDGDRFTPYLCNCFFFIFTMNVLGLIPFTGTATGNVSVTAGLALLTFLLTQAAAVKAAGVGGYLGHLTGGVHPLLWAIMIPVEFLGLFTKPFALCIRLFANMVAGHIVIYFLLGLIFIMKTLALAPVSIAFALGIYLLELFVALVQAYVFTMLSSLFIGMSVAMGHHGHGEAAHADKAGQH